MIKDKSWLLAGVLAVGAAAVAFASPGGERAGTPAAAPAGTPAAEAGKAAEAAEAAEPGASRPTHAPPAPKHGGTVVELCDGETNVEIEGALTPEKARSVSAELMRKWRAKNPNARWDVAQAPPAPAPARAAVKPAVPSRKPLQQEDVYGSYTARDLKVWEIETQKFVDKGNAIFHDAKQLGGTVSISCDMCHPNGANTHPETYPKFQVQLGRVALLRDMINWCIENPVKGKPLADDDLRLRAMEAYILAQRKGVALDFGKH